MICSLINLGLSHISCKYMEAQKKKIFAPYDCVVKLFLPIIPQKLEPNYLTVFRLIGAPVLILFLWLENYNIALLLFIVLGVTDMLDGSIARLRNKTTDWGKLWDPIADKILIGSVVVVLLLKINIVLTVILLAIESAFILGGAFQRIKDTTVEITANVWGKIKFNLQAIAGVSLILGYILEMTSFIYVGESFLYVSVLFAIMSLFKKGI